MLSGRVLVLKERYDCFFKNFSNRMAAHLCDSFLRQMYQCETNWLQELSAQLKLIFFECNALVDIRGVFDNHIDFRLRT